MAKVGTAHPTLKTQESSYIEFPRSHSSFELALYL